MMNVKLKKFNILEPNVKIKAKIITEIPDPIQELSGTPPLKFKTVSTELLDWSITAVTDGVGKIGKNYLKPKTEPIPNGAAGTYQGLTGWLTNYSDVGNTFTTPAGITHIVLDIRRSSENNFTPSDIGNVMLIEGDVIPSSYNASTTLCREPIMQGNLSNETWGYQSWTEGSSQILYAGYDTVGAVSYYGQEASKIAARCKSCAIEVQPNTTYSIRIFNANYNDIQIDVVYATASGTITPTVTACSPHTQKSIPGNETFVESTEQWIKLVYSHYRRQEYYYALPVDVRPMTYEYCESFATLKAGTYKLMIDTWGNNRFSGTGGYWTGIQDYSGCVYDNFSYGNTQGNEWFALLEEDNTVVIPKSDILPSGINQKAKKVDDGAPYPNYFHNEITFTLDHDAKVGLIHKAYYESNSDSIPAYHRFMIVDSDVEAEYFETTGAVPAQMQGYSAWAKYNISLPIITYKSDYSQAQRVVIDLGESYLEAGDTLTMADTGVTVPTFEGENIINVDSAIQPNMYIKYRRF